MTKNLSACALMLTLTLFVVQFECAHAERKPYHLQCEFKKSLVGDAVLGGIDPNSDGFAYISVELTTNERNITPRFSTTTSTVLPNNINKGPFVLSSKTKLVRKRRILRFKTAGGGRPIVLRRPLQNENATAYYTTRGGLGLSGCSSCFVKIAGSCSTLDTL